MHEGINYTIHERDGLLELAVFKRPDITITEGALAASEMLEWYSRGAKQHTGSVLDLTQAPDRQGPKTRAHFQEMVSCWETVGKRAAIVVQESQAVLLMQVSRIITQSAPKHGRVVTDLEQGRAWARGDIELPRTISSASLPRVKKP